MYKTAALPLCYRGAGVTGGERSRTLRFTASLADHYNTVTMEKRRGVKPRDAGLQPATQIVGFALHWHRWKVSIPRRAVLETVVLATAHR